MQEKLKSITIKGNQYVTVNERLKYFREKYPEFSLLSEMLKNEDGVVIFRATIYNKSRDAVATGFAYEKEGSSFINKTSYIENCECVPLTTEILTKNGFRFYYELSENEICLTVNVDTQEYEWQELQKISVYKSASWQAFNLFGPFCCMSCGHLSEDFKPVLK